MVMLSIGNGKDLTFQPVATLKFNTTPASDPDALRIQRTVPLVY